LKLRNIKNNYSVFFFIFLILSLGTCKLFSQVELVSVSHPVYDYLKRMQLMGVIKNYNSSLIPISRSEVSSYFKQIESSSLLTKTDKKILDDYKIEFEYELNNTLKNSTSLFKKFESDYLFSNGKQKYLYNYADSNATLFLDFLGDLSFRSTQGDFKDHSILLGDLGFRLRGTLFDKIGYELGFIGGKKLYGEKSDLIFGVENDPVLKANPKFLENNYFDFFNGYFKYQTKNNWLSLTLGREAINCGFGYADKLFISNNTVPFDFLKLDLNYKKIKYSFTYGSLKGDSLGFDLKSKNIAFHRLSVQFTDYLNMGYFETVVLSDNPFSFVYFNPISFLTSADLNTGAKETSSNNTLMGIDFEINPVKNVGLQGSLLVDDINFSTLFKNDATSFDNKLGYQVGTIWTNAFKIPNTTLIIEYTRLNPFIYSHRSNKNSYTNYGLSLGHALPPNSDEILLKINYNFSSRLKLKLSYQFQRSGEGIYYDSISNQIINYGGNINRGDGDNISNIKFLDGDRVNRNIFTAFVTLEPIKQYFFELQYQYKLINNIYLSKKDKEYYFWANLKVNI
jgi:hypothetical protein